MKKTMLLVLLLVLSLSLIGCNEKQVAEKTPTNDTQTTNIVSETSQDVKDEEPTQETKEETESTEPLKLDPYEEYISTVAKGEYRYVDLDGDGEQELIIYRKNSRSEIITISDGEPVVILSISDMFFCERNIIGRFSEGSGGMTLFYYQIDGQEAVIVDIIMRASSDGAWYHSSDSNIPSVTPQNMTQITEEDALKMSKQYALLDDSIPWFLTWFYEE